MEDALNGWTRAALARATTKAIAAASGGRGPKIAAADFHVWKLKGPREDGLIDFEFTIALPDGTKQIFWGYNRTSRHAPARTVQEVATFLAGDVMQTLEAAPALALTVATVAAAVRSVIEKPPYAGFGIDLVTVRPMTLQMKNSVPPEAVTVVALMRDHRLVEGPTEFDVLDAGQAVRLLEKWLPEVRRRAERAKALEMSGADGFVDGVTLRLLKKLGLGTRKGFRAAVSGQYDLPTPDGSLVRNARLHFEEGVLSCSFGLGQNVRWERNRVIVEGAELPMTIAVAAVGRSALAIVDCEMLESATVTEIASEQGRTEIETRPAFRVFRAASGSTWYEISADTADELSLGMDLR